MSAAVEHTLRYGGRSAVTGAGRPVLTLATAQLEAPAAPHFFAGRMREPRLVAELLAAIHQVVGTRFFTPPNTVGRAIALADPIITAGSGTLRLEGFSTCCSCFVRVDLPPAAYEGEIVGRGTTHVDFNAAMRAALAGVRDEDGLELAVGDEAFSLRSGEVEAVERKVTLPARWLRGLVEVQSYLSTMRRRFEVTGVQALRLLRTLPKASTSRTPQWLVHGGGGLHTTSQPAIAGVRISDTSRLRVLQALMPRARSLAIWADDAQQSSAWVLDFGSARLTLALSAETWRGFSGEGQALGALIRSARPAGAGTLARVRAALRWQDVLDARALAADLGTDPADVDDALRVLGASGLAGYDLDAAAHFHRMLPYDLALFDDLHPRLADARTLLAEGAVTLARPAPLEARVASGGTVHHVREQDGALRCTCPWYAKHLGLRGPCKHVLAVEAARPGGAAA
jgi:hypothetical protein